MKLNYYYDTCNVSVIYTGKDGITHTETARGYFKKDLVSLAKNIECIEKQINDINNVAIRFNSYEDIENPAVKGYIVQAAGYSPEAGLFSSLFPIQGAAV